MHSWGFYDEISFIGLSPGPRGTETQFTVRMQNLK